MTVLKVEEMHCEKCVERISKVLGAAGVNFKVSLGDRTVAVDSGSVQKAINELDDIGFTAKAL